MKEPIPQFPRRRLNAAPLLLRKPRCLIPIAKKLQAKFTSQSRNKFLVRIRLRPAQLVIEVNNRKDNPQLAPQLQQQTQKRNRINPAGNGHAYAVSSGKKLLPPKVGNSALDQRMHDNIVSQLTTMEDSFTQSWVRQISRQQLDLPASRRSPASRAARCAPAGLCRKRGLPVRDPARSCDRQPTSNSRLRFLFPWSPFPRLIRCWHPIRGLCRSLCGPFAP